MTATVTSEVQLCNMSLTRLGHPTITSLDQDTKGAALCKLHYPILRDAVLRAHPWNFAIKRAELASLASPGIAFEYTAKFALPDDCLKILRTSEDADGMPAGVVYGYPGLVGGGAGYSYRVEGKYILTNGTTCKIEYVARITDVAQFDALFVDALSARLTAEIAMAMTDNAKMSEYAMQSYEAKIREARQIDAQEGTPRDIVDATGWIMARF
jgi:hypothetical protein